MIIILIINLNENLTRKIQCSHVSLNFPKSDVVRSMYKMSTIVFPCISQYKKNNSILRQSQLKYSVKKKYIQEGLGASS